MQLMHLLPPLPPRGALYLTSTAYGLWAQQQQQQRRRGSGALCYGCYGQRSRLEEQEGGQETTPYCTANGGGGSTKGKL